MAQRLVRRVCSDCATPVDSAAYDRHTAIPSAIRAAPIVRGAGCPACRHTGYSGRLGVFELVVLSDAMQDAVARSAPGPELRELAERTGWLTMWDDAWSKVAAGLTTVEEVLRVVAA